MIIVLYNIVGKPLIAGAVLLTDKLVTLVDAVNVNPPLMIIITREVSVGHPMPIINCKTRLLTNVPGKQCVIKLTELTVSGVANLLAI